MTWRAYPRAYPACLPAGLRRVPPTWRGTVLAYTHSGRMGGGRGVVPRSTVFNGLYLQAHPRRRVGTGTGMLVGTRAPLPICLPMCVCGIFAGGTTCVTYLWGVHAMSKIIPTAVVIDRATAARMLPEGLDGMGGAWAKSFRLWQRLDSMQYVAMLAHTKKRMRDRAPLTWMARDDDALRAAMRDACANLSDTSCRWAILMEEGTAGIALVRGCLLAESSMEGCA